MAKPRLRRCLLATGAGLAAAYASVSDSARVIHTYYSDNAAASSPPPVLPHASIRRPAPPPPLAGLSSADGPGQAEPAQTATGRR
jgi:hypothetical protein